VSEHYDEIVFSDPGEAFFERVKDNPAVTVIITGDNAPPSAVEAVARPRVERARTPPVPEGTPSDGNLSMLGTKEVGSTLNHPLRPFCESSSFEGLLRETAEGFRECLTAAHPNGSIALVIQTINETCLS
jgi:hypothetical protein